MKTKFDSEGKLIGKYRTLDEIDQELEFLMALEEIINIEEELEEDIYRSSYERLLGVDRFFEYFW